MPTHFEGMLLIIFLLAPIQVARAQASAEDAANQPLISTGVTGWVKESGLDDPQLFFRLFPSSV
ncbi:MAG TPA: hypothetical protein VI488_02055 [Candidatus Angelobacter sp.]